jgi:hypothetical protein
MTTKSRSMAATALAQVRTWALAEQLVLLAIIAVVAAGGLLLAGRTASGLFVTDPKRDFVSATTTLCQAADKLSSADQDTAAFVFAGGHPGGENGNLRLGIAMDALHAEQTWYHKSDHVTLGAQVRLEIDNWHSTFADLSTNDSATLASTCWSMLSDITSALGTSG